MNARIPVILLESSSAPSFSLFNPNEWEVRSKAIIQSCAVNHGLLVYSAAKLKKVFSESEGPCQLRFDELIAQWKKSKWDLDSCVYWVDVPEAHVSIHAFLSGVKTFLDVFVQLISSEEIVHGHIHGFHRKGNNIGQRLLHNLKFGSNKSKKDTAVLIHDLICEHKVLWIDNVVNLRDLFTHPETGLSKVMFALDIYEFRENIALRRILKPSFSENDFDVYALKTLSMVEEFSKKFMQYLKAA